MDFQKLREEAEAFGLDYKTYLELLVKDARKRKSLLMQKLSDLEEDIRLLQVEADRS